MGGSCCGKGEVHEPEIRIHIKDQSKGKQEDQKPSQPQAEGNLKSRNEPQESHDLKQEEQKVSHELAPIDSTNQTNSNLQSERRILFVGKTGVGKTSLFKQISTESKTNTPFQEEKNLQYSYIAVDTPAFQMDDSIEEREKTISLFQEYIEKHKKTITTFAIVVNFERTDLMKKKISDVYKYLHKFKEMIAIIIVDWQLSDDQDRDKQHLEKQFKLYNQCKLCFVEKKQDHETLKLVISKIVFDIRETPIDLKDTIFEKNQSLDRSMEIKLQNLTNQIR